MVVGKRNFHLLLLWFLTAGSALVAETVRADDDDDIARRVPRLYEKVSRKEFETTPARARSQFFLGLSGLFGQANTLRKGSSSQTGQGFGFEVGHRFRRPTDPWRYYDVGIMVSPLTDIHNADASIEIPLAVLAKASFGFSMGAGIFGSFVFGFGPAWSNYSESRRGLEPSFSSDSAEVGIVASLNFLVESAPIQDTVVLYGGPSYLMTSTSYRGERTFYDFSGVPLVKTKDTASAAGSILGLTIGAKVML